MDNNNNNNNGLTTSTAQQQLFNYRKLTTAAAAAAAPTTTTTKSTEDKDIARIRLENDELVEEFKHLLSLEYDDIKPVNWRSIDSDADRADMQSGSMLNHLRHYYQLSSPLSTTTATVANDDHDDHDDHDDDADADSDADTDQSGLLDSSDNYGDFVDVAAPGKDTARALEPPERLMTRRHLNLSSGNIRSSNNNDSVVSGGGKVALFNYQHDEYERDLNHLLYTADRTSQSIPDKFNYDQDKNNNNNYDAATNTVAIRVPSEKKVDWQRKYDNTLSNSNTYLATLNKRRSYATCKEMPDCESGGVCVLDQMEDERADEIFYNNNDIHNNRRETHARCRCPIGRGGQLCNKREFCYNTILIL